ncbi:MAG: hypothetical protein IPN13_07315 [Bacteroidetes bacterium]|nr:hypothetical protein [Bacteroidota bacterium]MBK8873723.1 hypothetical protein [Bacteroidota bacterium]MBK9045679.1 hypothetical protein [Bacteroidota bacterium]
MRIILILLTFITSTICMGQKPAVEGIYYLENVMETASGFKLNEDNTFEFFFSQGALDRTGSGTWQQNGDQIIFNSNGKREKGFFMVTSRKNGTPDKVVAVKDPNTIMSSFVYARLISGANTTDFQKMSNEGEATFKFAAPEKIELMFELCPEMIHTFEPEHPGDNYFEFNFNPKIMDVWFEQFTMKYSENKLTGSNPLLKGEEFEYLKSK